MSERMNSYRVVCPETWFSKKTTPKRSTRHVHPSAPCVHGLGLFSQLAGRLMAISAPNPTRRASGGQTLVSPNLGRGAARRLDESSRIELFWFGASAPPDENRLQFMGQISQPESAAERQRIACRNRDEMHWVPSAPSLAGHRARQAHRPCPNPPPDARAYF